MASSSTGFLSLADEIIISILELIGLDDLSSCRKVNHRLRAIADAVSVPYRLCLKKFGLTSVSHRNTSLTIADLSRNLTRREENWASLTPSSMKRYYFPGAEDVTTTFYPGEFVINEFSEENEGWSLEVVQLASHDGEAQATFKTRHSRLLSTFVDVAQDLLVTIEEWRKSTPRNRRFPKLGLHFPLSSTILRFLCVSSMKHHPECPAAHGAVNVSPLCPRDTIVDSVAVAEGLVGLSLRDNLLDRLLFLNWKSFATPPIIIEFPEDIVLAFRFLDPNTVLVLLSGRTRTPLSEDATYVTPHGYLKLAIYNLSYHSKPSGSRVSSTPDSRYTLAKTLLFPKLVPKAKIGIDDVSILSGTQPSRISRSASEHLMPHIAEELAPHSGVIAITLNGIIVNDGDSSEEDEEGDSWILDLVIRTADLVLLSQRPPRILHWDGWSPLCRAFGHAPSTWLGLPKLFDCAGYRVATITSTLRENTDNQGNQQPNFHRKLDILDFSPIMTEKPLDIFRGRLVLEPSAIPRGIFVKDIRTALPYYAVQFDLGQEVLPESVTLTSTLLVIHVHTPSDNETEDDRLQYNAYSLA